MDSPYDGAGWSSSVARRAHNPKAAGSNPVPATNDCEGLEIFPSLFLYLLFCGQVIKIF